MNNEKMLLTRIIRFYTDGFRNMTWGRTLWIIILLKLFIMFAVLRVFFFQPALEGKSEVEKQAAVAESLSGTDGGGNQQQAEP